MQPVCLGVELNASCMAGQGTLGQSYIPQLLFIHSRIYNIGMIRKIGLTALPGNTLFQGLQAYGIDNCSVTVFRYQ
jgi:hypothetical protein